MAEFYNMVLNEDEVHWFFDHILVKPEPSESYMVCLACRGKKLTEEEREYTKVGSRGEMMREEIIKCRGGMKQEWTFDIFKQAIYRYCVDKRSLLTTAGVPYPEHAMVVYIVVNPSDEIDVVRDTMEYYFEHTDAYFDSCRKGSNDGKKDNEIKIAKTFDHMKSCHADNCRRRIWLDFDMDIKKELRDDEHFEKIGEIIRKVGNDMFGKGNVAVVRTNGGYHTLVRKEVLKRNPKDFIDFTDAELNKVYSETVYEEFVLNDSTHKDRMGNPKKRSAMLSLPGCRQYESYPYVINKEDFDD